MPLIELEMSHEVNMHICAIGMDEFYACLFFKGVQKTGEGELGYEPRRHIHSAASQMDRNTPKSFMH